MSESFLPTDLNGPVISTHREKKTYRNSDTGSRTPAASLYRRSEKVESVNIGQKTRLRPERRSLFLGRNLAKIDVVDGFL
jgi:hypothetical protein